MAKKTVFKIEKKYLAGLATWLNKQQLAGRASRERTRFCQMLATAIKTLEKERLDIVGKYVTKEKDEKGKPVWKKTVDNGQEQWDIPKSKAEVFGKEITELFDEEFILDIGEEHKEKMAIIKDIILNTGYIFGAGQGDQQAVAQYKIQEANHYEKWCEAFERI